ncbi:MAG: hypothetical protein HY720_09860 [Planctomycetes bacterium]|nr:hypothetical protein [Planctomycetota bacterium]
MRPTYASLLALGAVFVLGGCTMNQEYDLVQNETMVHELAYEHWTQGELAEHLTAERGDTRDVVHELAEQRKENRTTYRDLQTERMEEGDLSRQLAATNARVETLKGELAAKAGEEQTLASEVQATRDRVEALTRELLALQASAAAMEESLRGRAASASGEVPQPGTGENLAPPAAEGSEPAGPGGG